jgi:recombination protein RecA
MPVQKLKSSPQLRANLQPKPPTARAKSTKAPNTLAQTLVAGIRKSLGEDDADDVSLLSEDVILSDVTEFIPTGFPDVDRILGGGWPVGRASEVFGPEASGKTALAHRAIKACQDAGGTPVLLDYEHALDRTKMRQLGINPEGIVYITPKTIEKGWDAIWNIMDTLEKNPPEFPTLIVWDSVAAAAPKAELEDKTTENSHVGLVARAMSRGCRRMFRAISRVRAHMLWINQERDKIGGFSPGFMKPMETPGGKAIKYAASLRIRCQVQQQIREGVKVTGFRVKVSTKKNRVVAPFQAAAFVLDFKFGPSPALTAFADFIDRRIIKMAGKREGTTENVYTVPWHDEKVTKAEWIALCRTAGFQAQIVKAYNESASAVPAASPVPAGTKEEDDDEDGGKAED